MNSSCSMARCLRRGRPAASGFPRSSTAATSKISTRTFDKAFNATYADGTRGQDAFGVDGGLFASAPGFTDSGKWRAEDGKLCGSLRKIGDFCNEARFEPPALAAAVMY